MDPDCYPAAPPRDVEVPETKAAADAETFPSVIAPSVVAGAKAGAPAAFAGNIPGKAKTTNDSLSAEERRAMLKEVIDHTELLREFEGIIPDDELVSRKRALYAALPPVPPPFKKQKGAAQAGEDETGSEADFSHLMDQPVDDKMAQV